MVRAEVESSDDPDEDSKNCKNDEEHNEEAEDIEKVMSQEQWQWVLLSKDCHVVCKAVGGWLLREAGRTTGLSDSLLSQVMNSNHSGKIYTICYQNNFISI